MLSVVEIAWRTIRPRLDLGSIVDETAEEEPSEEEVGCLYHDSVGVEENGEF